MDPNLVEAAAIIQAGGLVGMPTETVYGLAADALNEEALLRIFNAKGRPRFDPLILHIAEAEQAWDLAQPSPQARLLAERCWPGPLTLVLPRRPIVPDLACSGLPTVALRCPRHSLAQALIRATGRPLAAPSANRFGRLSPTCAEAVREQLGDSVDLILDGGPCAVGVESTVLLLTEQPLVLRPGSFTCEHLSEMLGQTVRQAETREHNAALPPQAPGMLLSHYAPATPLHLGLDDLKAGEAALCFRNPPPPAAAAHEIAVLSPSGDLSEAARRLFAALRRLDASGASSIRAELVPEEGLGIAINDRLRRAAG